MSCPNSTNVNIIVPPGTCIPVEGCPDGPPVEVTGTVTIEGCVAVEGCPGGPPVEVTGTNAPADAEANPTDAERVIAYLEIWAPELANWYRATSAERFGGSRFAPEVMATVSHVTSFDGNVWPAPNTEKLADQGQSVGDMANWLPAKVNYVHTGYSGSQPPGSGFSKQRTPFIFNDAQAVAAGITALWTPAVFLKFRVMRYCVQVTGNAATAGGAVVTVQLYDGAAPIPGTSHDVFIPAAGVVAGQPPLYTSPWEDLGNGIISAAVGTVLNINLSAALIAGNVRVRVCGTEEQ